MSLWGKNDYATGNNKPLYSNTATTYGVSVTEAANTTGDGPKVTHSGWVKQSIGAGPVKSIAVTVAGTGYSNGYVNFTGGGGTGANASFFTDGNGNVLSVVVNSGGTNYTTAPSAFATGSNTAIATLSVTLGGRAGRRFYETLVATGSIALDDSKDDTYFPGV
jgi:hypothetical protein